MPIHHKQRGSRASVLRGAGGGERHGQAIAILRRALCTVLRRAGQIPSQSAACDLVEKSRNGLGARVMGMMIQTVWHFWCRALFYSCMVGILAVWLALVLTSVIVMPLTMFFGETGDGPETWLGKIHRGMFCVSVSFLMLALFAMCPFGMAKDDMKPEECMSNVIAAIAEKIAKIFATIGCHILAVAGLVLVVRTFMMIWARG